MWCMWAHGSQLKYQRKMVAPSMENKEPRATGGHVDSHVSCPLGGQVAQIPDEDGKEEEVESRI